MSQKLIKCKSCGEEIAKSAKTCPHCGAKIKKHTALGIALIIIGVLVFICAIGGNSDKPQKVDDGTSTSETPSPAPDDSTNVSEVPSSAPSNDIFSVGDKVSLGDIVVTLVSVTENTGGNYMTPSDGKVFVVCEFNIENNSSKDIAVSSMLSFDAYIDDYATNLNLSAMLSTNQSQLDGTIAAGKKMNGVVGYEADPDWSEIEIRFKPDFWSGGEIIFAATK